jgi:hypothetical protein
MQRQLQPEPHAMLLWTTTPLLLPLLLSGVA